MLFVGALLAAMAAGCGHSRGGGAADGGTLRVGFISTAPGEPTGPEGWAYRRGILLPALRKAGIARITFASFGNGPDLNEAIAAHAVDVGLLGDTPAIVGHAAGLPTRLINQSAVGMDCWLVVRPDGPKRVEDLRGKPVATQKGSYMARYLLGLLEKKGLSRDVTFVHLASTEAEAALRRGDIAAYASPYGPLLASHGLRILDEARDHPDLLGSSVTVATADFLAAHPGFPAAWNGARKLGIADLRQHQAEYYQWQAQRVKLPVDVYRALYPQRLYSPEPLTQSGLALLGGTKGFLREQHLARSDFSIDGWIAPGVTDAALPGPPGPAKIAAQPGVTGPAKIAAQPVQVAKTAERSGRP
jgi:NitT/TauT family transport system substrate-binding protein/sulfonate transport system substrate-binding protein